MSIRKATTEDLDRIMEIYRGAQAFMIRSGNPAQWGHLYPTRELLAEDVRQESCYVLTEDRKLYGVFVLCFGEEPTYRVIEDGQWLNDAPYVTIHRLAGDGSVHGVFRACAEFCLQRCDNVRIDTHADNLPMQRVIERFGFRRCGIIHVANGTPRIAYQFSAGAKKLAPVNAAADRDELQKTEAMQVLFRPAAAEDAAVISSLRKTIWGTTYRGIYPDKEIDQYDTERHLWRDLARIGDPSYLVYLIMDGDRPIGYLYFQHRDGVHIQSLYVLREYQRCGIGRMAFEIVQAYCRAQGLPGFTCNCNSHNQNARMFYAHMGGTVVAEDVGHTNLQEDQITWAFSVSAGSNAKNDGSGEY